MEFKVKSVLDSGSGLIEILCQQIEEIDPIIDFTQARLSLETWKREADHYRYCSRRRVWVMLAG